MHLFLHLCIMYHAWNFVMHPLLIFIESVTTNNWSLAIDPISDSCVGVPRSNAYETIDVRYRWEATRSVHLHPLVRVDSSGSARPEIGSKHVDTRGAASPHSGHPCPTISTSFLFVSTGMSLATGLSLHIFQLWRIYSWNRAGSCITNWISLLLEKLLKHYNSSLHQFCIQIKPSSFSVGFVTLDLTISDSSCPE